MLKGLLGTVGYKVVRALSGNEAMELMWSRDHLPDLILLDVEMPTESGYEVSFCRFLVISSQDLRIEYTRYAKK